GFAPTPLEQGVIYELHIGTFTSAGTFAGAIERLDQLVELGVTHLELMPLAEFPGSRGWGYDGVDLFAPHHAYGTPDDLKRLVDACHARGLSVLLDVVYNHLGPDGNYLGRFGPYFTREYATPWGAAVNLDGSGSDEVRRFFCDNALMWLENYHFDGLRLDAVHALLDRSAVPFLEQLTREVATLGQRLGRRKVLIAESDLNDPRLVRSYESGGLGCDGAWSDDFHHSLHALLSGERGGYYADFGELSDVRQALTQGFAYAGRYSAFRGRSQGRPLTGVPLSRLVGYLQNHDQIGNRAAGDRLGRSLSPEQLELAAALVLTGPFVPLLFQGEEWNAASPFQYFTDHQSPELGRAITLGRQRECVARGERLENVPDPQALETFQASKLDWYELVLPEHRSVLDWYRTLIRLRRSEPDLVSPEIPEVRIDPGGRWLTSRRGRVLVAANFTPGPLGLPTSVGARLLLGSRGAEVSSGVVTLPGWGVGILRVPG
ncbi:MAG TPA: malto-oligosyltrehalose trehalohydrolase, partial [Polyangiaceae bacterium]|nr:malto-oligosyltrehalose trehalohydrolase [Polyangiaceae bacterium]